MKSKHYNIVCNTLFILFVIAFFQDCIKDKQKIKYTANVPQYISYESLTATPIFSSAPKQLSNIGKIYFKDNYIFINEINKGVHVIDNTNPVSPQNISFIEIPGNVDIAIKGEILFADNYIDLLAIDISNINAAKIIKRLSKVFPISYPATNNNYPIAKIDDTKGIVIDWKLEEITEIVEKEKYNEYKNVFYDNSVKAENTTSASGYGEGISNKTNGIGGSMARFTIFGNYLYTIDHSSLNTIDISSSYNPTILSKTNVGINIETLFPYNDKLFIGSQTGMFIYSLSSPNSPTYISQFEHIRSCDPVVVSGNYAYVTLRSNSVCGGTQSQLNVIDISNIYSPVLIKSYDMEEPYGLGIDNNLLFICDGDAGLKAYNTANPMAIDQNKIAQFTNINAFDVIPYKSNLLLIGKTGLYQYDYSNPKQLNLVSTIAISKK